MNLKAVLPGLVFIGVGLYEAFWYWRLRATGRAVEVEPQGRKLRVFHHPANPDRAVMAGWRGLLAPTIYGVLGGILLGFGLAG